MELEGSLKAFSLPEVLQFLSMGKMSGTLHLTRGSSTISLTIKQGRIVNSSSLARNKRLGEMLVQRGFLRRRDLDEILSLQKTIESDKRLGQLLVERELITDQHLKDTLRLQVEEEVWDLFSWEEGSFKFEHGDDKLITEIAVNIDIEPLLLEGSRRQDEWGKIRRRISGDNVVLGLAPIIRESSPALKLSPTEWKVLAALNGVLSVQALVNRSTLGRFETNHILHALLSEDHVRVVDAITVARIERDRKAVVSPESISRAEALAASIAVESGSRGFGGFLGVFKGGGDKPAAPAATEVSFQMTAPASMVALLVSGFTTWAVGQKEFNAKPEESKLLEMNWYSIMMENPRADLLRVRDNVVDSSVLDEFIREAEYSIVVHECHEESVEAASKLLKSVYPTAAQRLGEKTSQKALQSMIETLTSRSTLRHGTPFDLLARCNRTLGLNL